MYSIGHMCNLNYLISMSMWHKYYTTLYRLLFLSVFDKHKCAPTINNAPTINSSRRFAYTGLIIKLRYILVFIKYACINIHNKKIQNAIWKYGYWITRLRLFHWQQHFSLVFLKCEMLDQDVSVNISTTLIIFFAKIY